jgi:hypothetical protein
MALQHASAPGLAYGAIRPRGRPVAERLQHALLVLTGVAGALVFVEPSPYEFVTLLAIGLFVATGMTLRPVLIPFAILLAVSNIGYTISAMALLDQTRVVTWVLTSWYLAVTALFFAAMLGTNTDARLDALMRGCLIAGVIAALAGIAGYFRLVPGADALLLYDRARGTFKDPNVYGVFLVLPALLALRNLIISSFWRAARNMVLLGIFSAGILLSFSRGAWGVLAFSSLLVLVLTFVTAPSANRRMRIVLIAIAGLAALALFIAALLSLDAVAELLKQRLSLNQSYDVGEQGRFGRHALGALLALDVPLGIGPLQFSKYFPEDPHNSFLNAFMSGGWVSGVGVATLVLLTLVFGLRAVFMPTPWQSTTIVVYAAYVGHAVEGLVIDTDHWRHMFLLLGVLWGLIAASRQYAARHDAAGYSPLLRAENLRRTGSAGGA